MTAPGDKAGKDWTDTHGRERPSQPGPTHDNPNEGGSGEETHGTGSAPSTGNRTGGGDGDTSGAPTP